MEGSEGGTPSPTVAVTVTAAADATGSHQPPSAALAAAVVREEKPASEISGMAAEPIKKRGRPRKYGPDGCLLRPLNPMSISASVPAGVRYTSAAAVGAALKRGRGRPLGSMTKTPQLGLDLEHLGEMEACSAGTNFTPHVITVASGEEKKSGDVTMKIISFSQQGPRAICILSANGIISNVTLRQPDSSGGTLTYEGRFELLSLSGSFMPTENGGTGSRSGGLSVSLASPDGRVVGGGVAGLLVAASPVQVVVGSFLPSYQMEQKIKKKPRLEAGSASTPPSAIPSSSADAEEAFGSGRGQHDQAATGKLDPSTTSPFGEESWAAALRSVPADFNMSLPGG
ncbi:hypothetical protein OPV22_025056 [Ensete ventricosum]|uniref:AT-hook motif nuclear-localized protein n=1 Tax=Ensete ventricosum TaxID=4639 RepID=A0AAV8QBM3_ENSVE|nr:hypothetical protein OPV22_025056 [Ensete ventricosum]